MGCLAKETLQVEPKTLRFQPGTFRLKNTPAPRPNLPLNKRHMNELNSANGTLTEVSLVADALVLRVEHGLLQHPQDDHGPDPELDPQQVPPVAGRPEQPQGAEQHVHDAHDHEELGAEQQRVRGLQCPTTLCSVVPNTYNLREQSA